MIDPLVIEDYHLQKDLFATQVEESSSDTPDDSSDPQILAEDSFANSTATPLLPPSRVTRTQTEGYASQIRNLNDDDSSDDDYLFSRPTSTSRLNETTRVPETAPQSSLQVIPETLPPTAPRAKPVNISKKRDRNSSLSSDESPIPKISKTVDKRDTLSATLKPREPSPDVVELTTSSRERNSVTSVNTTVTSKIRKQHSEVDIGNLGCIRMTRFSPKPTKTSTALPWQTYKMSDKQYKQRNQFQRKHTEDQQLDAFSSNEVQFHYYNVLTHDYHRKPKWPESYTASSKNKKASSKIKKEDKGEFLFFGNIF